MSSIMDIIAKEKKGTSFKSFKYSFEGMDVPSFDYDDHADLTWDRTGETAPEQGPKYLKPYADKIINDKPLFSFFLDGSRHAFKVDDISYRNQVYPVIAGQIGISCCTRIEKEMRPYSFEKRLVITLPRIASQVDWQGKLFFNNLKSLVNQNSMLIRRGIEFTDIKGYSTKKDKMEKMENKGIEVIQDLMISREIDMVSSLVSAGKVNYNNYLLKDGSLEYRVDHIKNNRDRRQFQSKFDWVVGASKSFNPANCKGSDGKNNSDKIAKLPLYCRTPVIKYTSPRLEGMKYAIWYVRIRDNKYVSNAFDGILKLEKILVSSEQLDTEEVDLITAHIINERNPVCYGADSRWSNHLYPIYVTEMYAKSKYLSNTMFLNLF